MWSIYPNYKANMNKIRARCKFFGLGVNFSTLNYLPISTHSSISKPINILGYIIPASMLSTKARFRASWLTTNITRKMLSSFPMFMATFRPMAGPPTGTSSSE